ncbi:helix-turn-helix transcriptional regulator [Streptosporangium sp. NPDC049046]|uniref:helix-turn-helix domain-containing protein n=1 Tax=Streptosporangium sp. NPDC049046 TaxID=3155031 RepID=UPI003431FC41
MKGSPTVRRRQLSAELIKLRKAAGLTAEEVVRHLAWSPGKLTYMEGNRWVRPDLANIRALLDLYGVADKAMRDAVLTLARQAREKGWWSKYSDVFRGSLAGFEAAATDIRAYQALFIPGLLQVPDYMTAIFRGGRVVDETLITRRVEARLARQEILRQDNPPNLWVIIDEAALRKVVGSPEIMVRQLEHVIELSARDRITVQVLPDAAGAHAAMEGSFMILDFKKGDGSIVYVETAISDLYLETTEELHSYTLIFDHARASALSAEVSAAHLTKLIDQLK